MGIFNKKKEVDKELPSLPSLPEMPTFPELPKERGAPLMNLQQFTVSVPQLPSEFESRTQPRSMVMEIGEEEKKGMTEIAKLKEQPIFVKIDKYREAVMNLEMIKKKLQETSNLLEKIKETRAKEEEELNIWVEEVNTIKEKIEMIDKKLFGSI
jgi:hypothetical protein